MYIYLYMHINVGLYVCMYVCMHVCIHVCMHACMYVRTSVHADECQICIHLTTYVYIRIVHIYTKCITHTCYISQVQVQFPPPFAIEIDPLRAGSAVLEGHARAVRYARNHQDARRDACVMASYRLSMVDAAYPRGTIDGVYHRRRIPESSCDRRRLP